MKYFNADLSYPYIHEIILPNIIRNTPNARIRTHHLKPRMQILLSSHLHYYNLGLSEALKKVLRGGRAGGPPLLMVAGPPAVQPPLLMH